MENPKSPTPALRPRPTPEMKLWMEGRRKVWETQQWYKDLKARRARWAAPGYKPSWIAQPSKPKLESPEDCPF